MSARADNSTYPQLLDVLYFDDEAQQRYVTSCFRGVDPRLQVLPGLDKASPLASSAAPAGQARQPLPSYTTEPGLLPGPGR